MPDFIPARRTGWAAGLMQDECRGLSRALSNTPDARRHAREAAAAIRGEACKANGCDGACNQGRDCSASTTATRTALLILPHEILTTRNGGETVNTDQPVTTPEDMADFFWLGIGFFLLFVIGVPALIWFMRSWPVLLAASQF